MVVTNVVIFDLLFLTVSSWWGGIVVCQEEMTKLIPYRSIQIFVHFQ